MEAEIAEYRTMVTKAAAIHWSRIRGKSYLDLDDLKQAGMMGLIDALRLYDPAKGNKPAYLWKTIYLRIQKEITYLNHTFYTSRYFKDHVTQVSRAGGEGDAEYWAKQLGVPLNSAREVLMHINTEFQSMDYSYDNEGEGFTLHDLIGKPDVPEDDGWENIDLLCATDFERKVLRLLAAGYVQREISEMTGRPEYSVYKAFRKVRERYAGVKTHGTQTITQAKKEKRGRPRSAVYG